MARTHLKIGLMSACLALSSAPVHAAQTQEGWRQTLSFVADTAIENKSLCHLVRQNTLLGLPWLSESMGYVLAENACVSDSFEAITPEQFAAAQAEGLIAASVPAVPHFSLLQSAGRYTFFSLGGLLVLALLVFRTFGRRGPKPAGGITRISPAVAGSVLEAMCRIAKVNGTAGFDEIAIVRNVYTYLTGQDVEESAIESMLLAIPLPVEPDDLESLAEGLNKKEKRLMMRATLMVAVARGRIAEREHNLVTSLADKLRISGNDMRQMLTQIARDRSAAI
jgi:hypothetical protein